VPDSSVNAASFWQRNNDITRRDFTNRAIRFLRSQVINFCAAGFSLAQEPRAFTAWRRGWDNKHYRRLLHWRDAGFCPQVVYDIGAHVGDWTEMCQAIYAPRDCYLFEPQKDYLERARPRQSRQGNWNFLPVALGDVEKEGVLHLTQNRAATSLLTSIPDGDLFAETRSMGQTRVRVVPLDILVRQEKLPPPDLVKIDVQGFEAKVIAGGTVTLRQAKRIVIETSLCPIYEGQPLLPEILEILSGWGFQFVDFSDASRTWPNDCLWQADLWFKRPD
jgi:FkbM family methyltransferase